MIKNQLYPYIEEYINSFLYGFTKEQLDVGLMNGQIKLENLNLRPDGVNDELDRSNTPFWLKAGLISNINLCCSLMNFIGEKPIEANIEGVNIILTPSYKWIIQNLDSFIFEDLSEMKSEYGPFENNSVNIFGKRINVLDNSIFNKAKIEKIFKDPTKISNLLNKIFLDCFEYYYSKNFSLILKLKNLHIRFEDDQLINYMGNIALGCKIDLFELTLSSEGTMKKNNFKITKLDIYWENNANILIPSSILNDSIKNGVLNDSYYTNLKKIKFENFSYKKDTKFIVKNLNCFSNFGTKAMNKGKIDLFGKKENNYKLYIQFASNEININFFPDLNIIRNNFRKFVREFTIIGQAQEFKPMKKPYNKENRHFIEILKYIKNNKNSHLTKTFLYKRKMMVRDWLFYFYWCHKCKSSIYNYDLNPLRSEFSRYYNLVYKNNGFEKLKDLENEKEDKKKEQQYIDDNGKPIWSKEKPNPDNINLIFNVDIKVKGLNLNLYPFIASKDSTEFINIKIKNLDSKIILNNEKFELNFSVKDVIFGPSKLNSGEKVIITNNSIKRRRSSNNFNNDNSFNKNNYSNYLTENDVDSNMGINGLLKKYNPNLNQQLNALDKAMKKINNNDSQSNSNEMNKRKINSERNNDKKNFEEIEQSKISNNSSRDNQYTKVKNNNFTKNLIRNYEPTPIVQKMELNRQKNEFNISQAINQYNNTKSFQKSKSPEIENNNDKNNFNSSGIPYPKRNNTAFNNNTLTRNSKNQNTEIVPTGQVIPLNLFELSSEDTIPCLQFKYIKTNNNTSMDIIRIKLGIIRVNLFSEYILKCANILNDYRYAFKKAIIKSIKTDLSSLGNDLNIEKQLYEMRKYFLEKISKLPDKKKTKQIQTYMTYLKNELEKSNKIIFDTDNYEINYIFSIFSKGVDINIDYDNLECIYYNNKNKKICGKAIMPSPMFNFKVCSSNISFKLYDFEFDIDDLDNTKLLFKTLHTILEDKFKMTQLLIEPCMQQIKKDIEKREKELISLEKRKKNHNQQKNLNKLIANNLILNNKNKNENKEKSNDRDKEKDKDIETEDIIFLEEEKVIHIPKKDTLGDNINISNKKEFIPIPQKILDNNKHQNNTINKSLNSMNTLNTLNSNKGDQERNNNSINNKRNINKEKKKVINKNMKKFKTSGTSLDNKNLNINVYNTSAISSQNKNVSLIKENQIKTENNIHENKNDNIIQENKNKNDNTVNENKIKNNNNDTVNEKKDDKIIKKISITKPAYNPKKRKSNEKMIIQKKKVEKSKKQITKKKIDLNPVKK